jgi:hypothetical protein
MKTIIVCLCVALCASTANANELCQELKFFNEFIWNKVRVECKDYRCTLTYKSPYALKQIEEVELHAISLGDGWLEVTRGTFKTKGRTCSGKLTRSFYIKNDSVVVYTKL